MLEGCARKRRLFRFRGAARFGNCHAGLVQGERLGFPCELVLISGVLGGDCEERGLSCRTVVLRRGRPGPRARLTCRNRLLEGCHQLVEQRRRRRFVYLNPLILESVRRLERAGIPGRPRARAGGYFLIRREGPGGLPLLLHGRPRSGNFARDGPDVVRFRFSREGPCATLFHRLVLGRPRFRLLLLAPEQPSEHAAALLPGRCRRFRPGKEVLDRLVVVRHLRGDLVRADGKFELLVGCVSGRFAAAVRCYQLVLPVRRDLGGLGVGVLLRGVIRPADRRRRLLGHRCRVDQVFFGFPVGLLAYFGGSAVARFHAFVGLEFPVEGLEELFRDAGFHLRFGALHRPVTHRRKALVQPAGIVVGLVGLARLPQAKELIPPGRFLVRIAGPGILLRFGPRPEDDRDCPGLLGHGGRHALVRGWLLARVVSMVSRPQWDDRRLGDGILVRRVVLERKVAVFGFFRPFGPLPHALKHVSRFRGFRATTRGAAVFRGALIRARWAGPSAWLEFPVGPVFARLDRTRAQLQHVILWSGRAFSIVVGVVHRRRGRPGPHPGEEVGVGVSRLLAFFVLRGHGDRIGRRIRAHRKGGLGNIRDPLVGLPVIRLSVGLVRLWLALSLAAAGPELHALPEVLLPISGR